MDEITKRFYVGANKVFTPNYQGQSWAKETVEEAIEHATKILEAEPDKEFAFIVEVIKIVRRPRMPMVIEDLKR